MPILKRKCLILNFANMPEALASSILYLAADRKGMVIIMKKKLHYYLMILFLALLSLSILTTNCLAFNGAAPDFISTLQSLSAEEGAMLSSDENAERIEVLTNLICMYSEQLEEYDRAGGTFAISCIGFIGVVLGLVFSFSNSMGKKESVSRPNYRIALLYLLISCVIVLCMYVFSLQCRRVEFFRGYLSYLEETLGELIGIPMVFNSKVVGTFFGDFPTMQSGFWVMLLLVGIMLIVSYGACFYYASYNGLFGTEFSIRKFMILLLFIFISIFLAWYCYIIANDFRSNDTISYQVYQYCLQFFS